MFIQGMLNSIRQNSSWQSFVVNEENESKMHRGCNDCIQKIASDMTFPIVDTDTSVSSLRASMEFLAPTALGHFRSNTDVPLRPQRLSMDQNRRPLSFIQNIWQRTTLRRRSAVFEKRASDRLSVSDSDLSNKIRVSLSIQTAVVYAKKSLD
jgi:hypothetical protein